MVVGIAGDHLRQGELGDVLVVHGHANEAFGVGRHEVDVLGRGKLARTDEVAFVFTIGIVGDEDDLAGAKVFKRLFNGVERMGHDVSSLSEAKGFGSLED